MTVREYVGARYVPLLMGQWDNTVSYEPLSIVLYEGDSYTSRQAVPIGIDITNEAYWVCTGNYNAQVEYYRQQVVALENKIPANSFDSTNTVKKYIDDNIDSIKEIIPFTNFDSENTIAQAISNEVNERELQDSIRIISFANVAAMKSSNNIEAGMICHTNGFYTSGDGGAAYYEISATGTANDMDIIACGDLYAHLIITNSFVTPEIFGSPCNNIDFDTDYLAYILDNYNQYPLVMNGIYKTRRIQPTKNFEINGTGIVYLPENSGFIYIPAPSVITRIRVSGITIQGTGEEVVGEYPVFENSSGCTISNVVYDGVTFNDVPFGIYLNATTGGVFKDAVVKNCNFNNIVGNASGHGDGVAAGTGHTELGNIQIVNNHFEQCGRHSIYVSNGYNVIVTGNTVNNHAKGYEVEQTNAAINIGRCNDVIVENNIVSNFYTTPIYIFNQNNHNCSNVNIANNIIYNAKKTGNDGPNCDIIINTGSPAINGNIDNVKVHDNIILEGSELVGAYNIEIRSGLNIEVYNNKIIADSIARNYKSGIKVRGYGGTDYSNYFYIHDNFIACTGTPSYGLSFEDESTSSTDMVIFASNNMIKNGMTSIQGSPVSTNFRMNQIHSNLPYQADVATNADLVTVATALRTLISNLKSCKLMN